MAFIPNDYKMIYPPSEQLVVGDTLILRKDLVATKGIFTKGHRFSLSEIRKVSESYILFILGDNDGNKVIFTEEELIRENPAVIKNYPLTDVCSV